MAIMGHPHAWDTVRVMPPWGHPACWGHPGHQGHHQGDATMGAPTCWGHHHGAAIVGHPRAGDTIRVMPPWGHPACWATVTVMPSWGMPGTPSGCCHLGGTQHARDTPGTGVTITARTPHTPGTRHMSGRRSPPPSAGDMPPTGGHHHHQDAPFVTPAAPQHTPPLTEPQNNVGATHPTQRRAPCPQGPPVGPSPRTALMG